MKFNEIQNDIIAHIIAFNKEPKEFLTPSVDVLIQMFQDKYSKLEIEENVEDLISRGILEIYSYHSYLNLTETFKTRIALNTFKERKK